MKKAVIIATFGEKDSHEADLLITAFKKIFEYFEMPILNILLAPNVKKGRCIKKIN